MFVIKHCWPDYLSHVAQWIEKKIMREHQHLTFTVLQAATMKISNFLPPSPDLITACVAFANLPFNVK